MEVLQILLAKVIYPLIGIGLLTLQGIANPVATILSASMMLRYSFGLVEEAEAIDRAVEKVLDAKDIGGLEIRTR